MTSIVPVLIALLPVFLFLVGLIVLDSYKLVKKISVIYAILFGCLAAALSYFPNTFVVNLGTEQQTLRRYIAPVIEETFKAVYLVVLLKKKRVGFMVDAAIYGFAIGAGFAFIENIFYLTSVPDSNLLLWVIRGFGTAVMHGGTTAIVGILAKNTMDYTGRDGLAIFGKGLLIAMVIHSYYNHFFLHPVFSPLTIMIGLPLTLLYVFQQSEQTTREWLGVGFDSDVDLLQTLTDGNLPHTKIGTYLKTLQSRFRGEVIADMICYLQIYLELSIRAKGVLLMREAGFEPAPEADTTEKFEELKFLERSIGKTGKLALHPFLHTSGRNLWQLNMLQQH